MGLTPEGAFALTADGHDVVFEAGCGEKSGHSDAAYVASGGQPLATADEVWATCDLVVKVKEPVESEYRFLRKGLTLFTYLHLAAELELT